MSLKISFQSYLICTAVLRLRMLLQRKNLNFNKKCNDLYYLAEHNSHFRYQSLPSLPFVQSILADLCLPFDPVNRKDQ